mgnify:FL=1
MKFRYLTFIFATLFCSYIMAQKIISNESKLNNGMKTLSGEYHYRKMELVSGFLFTPDGKFEFYYSYGASDRNATGTYHIEGDTLKLKSDKKGEHDFAVDKQGKKSGFITIKINSPDAYLASSVLCMCIIDGIEHKYFADNNGLIETNITSCDKIFVQHLLFPDVFTQISKEKFDNNYFELSLLPSLQQVSFKYIDFIIKDDVITCYPNYFLPFEDIEFVKE